MEYIFLLVGWLCGFGFFLGQWSVTTLSFDSKGGRFPERLPFVGQVCLCTCLLAWLIDWFVDHTTDILHKQEGPDIDSACTPRWQSWLVCTYKMCAWLESVVEPMMRDHASFKATFSETSPSIVPCTWTPGGRLPHPSSRPFKLGSRDYRQRGVPLDYNFVNVSVCWLRVVDGEDSLDFGVERNRPWAACSWVHPHRGWRMIKP